MGTPSAEASNVEEEAEIVILLVIGIILLVLWLLGLVSAITLGGLIYYLRRACNRIDPCDYLGSH